ncbi:MAG: DUF1801 domain-containing protein [Chloroflexota bacterium]
MTTSTDEITNFLAGYPIPIAGHARRLHELVLEAVPSAVARIRPGWRLIGYDLPITRHGTYFAWVAPETEHVHVGWQTGTLMADPQGQLRGAHLKLKKVRYLTYGLRDRIAPRVVLDFTRDAARIAAMSRGERELIARARSA